MALPFATRFSRLEVPEQTLDGIALLNFSGTELQDLSVVVELSSISLELHLDIDTSNDKHASPNYAILQRKTKGN